MAETAQSRWLRSLAQGDPEETTDLQIEDNQEARFEVHILGAAILRDADAMVGQGKSDPYCVCEVVGKPYTRFQTLAVNDSLNPEWNHIGEVRGVVAGDDIMFTVFDKDWGTKDDVLGKATLRSAHYQSQHFSGMLPLSQAGEGISANINVVVRRK